MESDSVKGTEVKVGDLVWDDLLGSNAVIVKLGRDKHGNLGIWVDNDYLDGARFPWEISPAKEASAVDKTIRLLGLKLPPEDVWACKALEARGLRICVDFGYMNAFQKYMDILCSA